MFSNFKYVLAPACVLVSIAAFAQSEGLPISPSQALTNHAFSTAKILAHQAKYMKPAEIQKIGNYLNAIDLVIQSGASSPGRLSCVSKDNDGSNPWQVAVEKDPVTVHRVKGLVMGSKSVA